MTYSEKEMEQFAINIVKDNPGIRRTKMKDLIRKKFDIGHAAALSLIDRLVGQNKKIQERKTPPNWKMYYPIEKKDDR